MSPCWERCSGIRPKFISVPRSLCSSPQLCWTVLPMTPLPKNSGQALLETAIVLPILFFAAIVFFTLLALCRNAIALQNAAADQARAAALQTQPAFVRMIG